MLVHNMSHNIDVWKSHVTIYFNVQTFLYSFHNLDLICFILIYFYIKEALRVPPTETRLTVYRRRPVWNKWQMWCYFFVKWIFGEHLKSRFGFPGKQDTLLDMADLPVTTDLSDKDYSGSPGTAQSLKSGWTKIWKILHVSRNVQNASRWSLDMFHCFLAVFNDS